MRTSRTRVLTALAAVVATASALLGAQAMPASAAVPHALGDVAPVASYDFDHDSGTTVVDSSGGGNNAAWKGAASYVPGVSGSGVAISNGANYVKLPLVAGQTDGSGSFSYEFWVNEQSKTSYGTLVSNQNFVACNNAGLTLYNNASVGHLEACFGTTAGGNRQYVRGLTPTSTVGSWHHVAVVVDRGTQTLTAYEDGVQTARTSSGQMASGTTFNSGLAFNIGGLSGTERDSADGYTNAYIDNFEFYNQAISADQVARDYTAANPANYHTITVTSDGPGSASASQSATGPGTAVSLSATAVPGHHLAGYQAVTPADLAIGADGTFTMPAEDVVINARFADNASYTVRFDSGGPTAGTMNPITLDFGQTVTLPPNAFTSVGREFAGWATSPNGPVAYADQARVADLLPRDGTAYALTLYAVWTHATRAVGDEVSPVASYDFDHDDGAVVVDSSGSGTNAEWKGTASYVNGVSGRAIAVSNGANYMKLPLVTDKTDASGSFSYAFWINEQSRTSYGTLVSNQNFVSCNNVGLTLYNQSSAGHLQACFGQTPGGTKQYPAGFTPTSVIGSWHHVAVVVDRGTQTLTAYEDGVQTARTSSGQITSGTNFNSGLAFNIGGLSGSETDSGDGYTNAYIDNFDFYNQAISADQVARDFSETSPTGTRPVLLSSDDHGTVTATPTRPAVGATVALTPTPNTGYHFATWSDVSPSSVTIADDGTFVMPDAAVAVKGTFEPNAYTVHFDANAATGGEMADQAATYDTPLTLGPLGFTSDGNTFAGWATTPDGEPIYGDGASVTNLTAADGGTATLYAVWLAPGSYLIHVTNDGHGTASASVHFAFPGDTVTVTSVPSPGYHFDGWQAITPGDLAIGTDNTFSMPSEDVTVKAVFAPNTYTVHFDGNGAVGGATADQTFTYGGAGPLAANGFGRTGYRFAGWSTTPTGAVAYADGASVENLTADEGATVTLYAQWAVLTAGPGSWASLPAGFVTDTFKVPGVQTGDTVQQTIVGLWNGAAPTAYTKASGDSWLSVSSSGVVSGTAPSTVPQYDGVIVVSATSGSTTSRLTVEIPVRATGDRTQVQSASLNAWDAGSHVTDSVGKDLAAIAARGIGLVGVQENGGTVAQSLATALGWYSYDQGDLGILSAWPIVDASITPATDTAPAIGVTISVGGAQVRVWDVWLSESNYGPELACAGVTDIASRERTTARYAQAQAAAARIAADVATAGDTPVIVLGDLASPSSADWTQATSASHCDAGAVAWPVPDAFAAAGLTDSFRAANPDPSAKPGLTWSPLVKTNGSDPEPQDRIDYVWYAGNDLHVDESHTLVTGWPSASAPTGNSWTSDHAAVVTTFMLGSQVTPIDATTPTVTVKHDSLVFQAGQGPADDAALLSAIGVTADPATAEIRLDRGATNFDVPGWYTVLLGTALDGYASDPVPVTVHVVAPPLLTLSAASATFEIGSAIDEPGVLGQLIPVADPGADVAVDLSGVNNWIPATYPVTVTATDQWGFASTVPATVEVTGDPDTTAPELTAAVTPGTADGADGWYVSVPTLAASATDNEGIAPTLEYRVNGGDWAAYTDALTVADGVWTYDFQATDKAGNVATSSVQLKVDTVAPGLSTAVAPAAADGTDGWYVSVPSVSATATDNLDAVTVEYRVNGSEWQPYTDALPAAEGTSTYEIRATDPAGNVTTTDPLALRVDTAAPVTVASTSAGPEVNAPVTVALSGGDAGSGVASTRYRVDGGDWVDYAGSFAVTRWVDAKTVEFFSADAAGNVEGVRSLVVPARELTTPVVTATATSPVYGAGTAATVTVTVRGDVPVDGVVSLTEGATARGTATLVAGAAPFTGTATFTLPVGLAVGEHAQAVSYGGSVLLTPAVGAVTVVVGLPAAWDAAVVYDGGDRVGYQGRLYEASWWTRGQAPGADPNGPWQELAMTEDGAAVWAVSRVFDAGDRAVYQGRVYDALWYTRGQVPGADPYGPWQEIASAADGTALWTASRVFDAGDVVLYEGARYEAGSYTRNQVPGAANGPWRLVG